MGVQILGSSMDLWALEADSERVTKLVQFARMCRNPDTEISKNRWTAIEGMVLSRTMKAGVGWRGSICSHYN